ncbi:hypothetical protein Acsp01_85060 [Actinoplanes sp. NBRC 101535]|nr:hypothetical protein Acsp01_85060 [Actinoplanes sp. NBRC 101535]
MPVGGEAGQAGVVQAGPEHADRVVERVVQQQFDGVHLRSLRRVQAADSHVVPGAFRVGRRVGVAAGAGVCRPRPRLSCQQVGSPLCAGTLTAVHAALTALNSVQLFG